MQAAAGSSGVIGYLRTNIENTGKNFNRVMFGFVGAWATFAFILLVMPNLSFVDHAGNVQELSDAGMTVLAIVVWASIMWVSEAMPVGITGISVPTLLILTEVFGPKAKVAHALAFQGFTKHVVWLCLFAFLVGAIMQLLKLDRRIALGILDKIKASNVGRVIWGMFGVNIILAFLIPAANARAATLLPVVKGITNLLGDTPEEQEAKKAIVIQSLVYGTMICGVFILTAHLPNLIMLGIFEDNGYKGLGYLDWMLLQFPYLGMFVLTQWWVRYHFKTKDVVIAGGHERIHQQHMDLGKMTAPEWVLISVFVLVALAFMMGKGSWIYEAHNQKLGIIALAGLLLLFVPGLFPFKWQDIQNKTIWGTFLLLGGAITMTAAMQKSGLAGFLADYIHGLVEGRSWWMTILILMLGTHLIRIGMLSNVAAIAMLAPILFAMAGPLDLHPVAFTLLVSDTDTYAYLLPTQITAAVIAYGSQTFSVTDYAKAGWLCILIAIGYGIIIMAPWYALLGMPVWEGVPAAGQLAPWPFGG